MEFSFGGMSQFKGMNKELDVLPYPSAGRGPSALPDHPVWKTTEPAVALGLLEVIFKRISRLTDSVEKDVLFLLFFMLFVRINESCALQRELEMSANHPDGGKLKLEQLLQCEVDQQQRLTNLRRDTFRNLAIKAYFDRPVAVQQQVTIASCARKLRNTPACSFLV